MDIYLIRHGETEWNMQGRFQGRKDSPLTALGREQAARIGRRLGRIIPPRQGFRLLTSPLGRARETADIVGRHLGDHVPIIDARLREVTLGCWDGLLSEDIDAGWPEALAGSTRFDWYFRSPDGENYEAAVERAGRWLGDMEGTVIAISHGLLGRLIRGIHAGLDREAMLGLPVPQDVAWHLEEKRRLSAISA